MILLVTTLVLAQAWDKPVGTPEIRPRTYRSDGPFRTSRLGSGDETGSFEFAPSTGIGMGAACACVNPTGSRGETMTFTRSSDAFCTKANTTSSILNGDLVACSTDQIRVMPGGDGTGALGTLLEITRTNAILRSQEFDNAAWTKDRVVAAAPVVWANDAGAPDGTATADAIHIDATSGGQQSIVYQTGAGNNVSSLSLYVKGAVPPDGGVAQAGQIDFITVVSSAQVCAVCSYAANTWTRCTMENLNINLGGYLWFGNDSFNCPGTKTAQDVLVWGAQVEVGPFVSSYIPTTSAAVARSADSTAVFTMQTAIGPNFSLAASAIWPSTNATIATAAQLGTAAPDMARVGRTNNTSARYTIGSTVTTPAVAAMGVTEHRASLADTGGVRNAYWDLGLSTAPAASMTTSTTAAVIGVANGVVKKVCMDPNPARCR